MNFLQRTPFFRMLLPFICGIAVFQSVGFTGNVLFLALTTVAVLLIAIPFFIRVPEYQFRFRWLFGAGIVLFFFLAGYGLTFKNKDKSSFGHIGEKGFYMVELTEAPIEKSKTMRCKVQVLQYLDSTRWSASYGKAIVYLQKDKETSKLLFGDRLMVRATFNYPDSVVNPDGFDYRTYLKRQGIGATAYVSSSEWRHAGFNNEFSIRRIASKYRNRMLNVYRSYGISGDEFAVLAALTLGYTDELQPDLRASYSATGAMHILSVSGLHVGIIYVVIAFLLRFLNTSRRRKILKGVIVVLFLWMYVFITGMSPSVIRSALMFSMVAVADCFDRKSQIYNTIFMSALFMLLYNPDYIFDIGFQLSYGAVLSIVFFQPLFSKIYAPVNKPAKWLWDLTVVSVAAQIGVFPVIFYYFHQSPTYFLITNLLAIPLSSAIIYLAILVLAVSFIPVVCAPLAFLLKWLVWSLNYLMVFIQHLPGSVYYVSVNPWQMALLFSAIFCMAAFYYYRTFRMAFAGLLFLLAAIIINISIKYQTLTTNRLIVYSDYKNTHVNFIRGQHNYVFSTDSAEAARVAGAFWKNNKIGSPEFIHRNHWFSEGFALFEGKRICILTDRFLKYKSSEHPLEVDYLIIGNKIKLKPGDIFGCLHPKYVIVDKTISERYAAQMKNFCKNNAIRYYSVNKSGAFQTDF